MTVCPDGDFAAAPALGQGLHVCLVRVLDCLYENGLDACSLVLDGAGLESAVLLRQALTSIAEVRGSLPSLSPVSLLSPLLP